MIFFLFHIEIEEKCGWMIGGPKGMLAPLSNYWGGGGGGGGAGHPPLRTPMKSHGVDENLIVISKATKVI